MGKHVCLVLGWQALRISKRKLPSHTHGLPPVTPRTGWAKVDPGKLLNIRLSVVGLLSLQTLMLVCL
jgi:hypothetical protein